MDQIINRIRPSTSQARRRILGFMKARRASITCPVFRKPVEFSWVMDLILHHPQIKSHEDASPSEENGLHGFLEIGLLSKFL
jgi:hypothetical protein